MTSDEISAGVSSLVCARQELIDRAVSRAIEKAVAAERRRCVKIAEDCMLAPGDQRMSEVAERIRSGE